MSFSCISYDKIAFRIRDAIYTQCFAYFSSLTLADGRYPFGNSSLVS